MAWSGRRLLALVAVAAIGGGATQAVAAPSHARVTKTKARKKAGRAAPARAVKVDAGRGRVPPRLLASRPPLTGSATPGATGPGGAPTTSPTTVPGAPGGDAGAPPLDADPPSLQAVGVTVDDRDGYAARLSRASIAAGPVVVQLINQGEDDHNLRVIPTDHAGAAVDFPLTGAGQNATKTLTLTAGHYRVFCTLTTPVNHETAGMNATLTVSASGP